MNASPYRLAPPRNYWGNASAQKLVSFLLSGGLAMAFLYQVATTAERRENFVASPDGRPLQTRQHSSLYDISNAVQVTLLMGAATLACVTLPKRRSFRTFMGCLVIFFIAGAITSLRTFTLVDWRSPQLYHSSGVFGAVVSLVIVVGLDRERWPLIHNLFAVLSIALGGAVVVAIASSSAVGRGEAMARLHPYVDPLVVLVAWLFLYPHRTKMLNAITWCASTALILGAIMLQTRAYLVLFAVILVFYSYVCRRRRTGVNRIVGFAVVALLVGVVAIALLNSGSLGSMETESLQGLSARRFDDSRSDQIQQFFESVRPSELILGRGAMAPWLWNGKEHFAGPDIGYLSLLYYGGLPLLFGYIIVHIVPVVRMCRSRDVGLGLSCALTAVVWLLSMCSAVGPSPSLSYYPALLCVGGAVAFRPWKRSGPYSYDGHRLLADESASATYAHSRF